MNSGPLGPRLRSLREALGMSLRAFAGAIELSPTYVSLVERGKAEPPTAERLEVIARVLRADCDELCLLAGRLPPDLPALILANPQLPGLIRKLAAFSTNHRASVLRIIERRGKS